MKQFYFLIISLFFVNGAVAQWVTQNSGTTKNLNSVYFTNANTGYAVGDSGTIIKTNDGGTNWTNQASETDSALRSVCFPEENLGYAVGNGGSILKTTNGGMNWISQSAGILGNLNSVYFEDAYTGYAVGGYQQGDSAFAYILKTTNGGTLWSINYIYGDTAVHGELNSVYFTDANTGYAVGQFTHNITYGSPFSPIILKTTNGGTDWTIQNVQIGCKLNSVYFTNADTGYAVGFHSYFAPTVLWWGYLILKTTNGGTDWSWTQVNCWAQGGLRSVYFTDANTGYAVGICTGNIILKTINSGIDWTSQLSNSLTLNSVYFSDIDTGYTVGLGGTILKTTNGGLVGLIESGINAEPLTIYPNPAKDKITMESSVVTGNTRLSILNVNSQEIMEIPTTDHKIQIDVSKLPAGIYFVKLKNKNTVEVRKLIKE